MFEWNRKFRHKTIYDAEVVKNVWTVWKLEADGDSRFENFIDLRMLGIFDEIPS